MNFQYLSTVTVKNAISLEVVEQYTTQQNYAMTKRHADRTYGRDFFVTVETVRTHSPIFEYVEAVS